MALTDVWWREDSGEWIRTTASETDKYFKYSVCANSNMFRCYKCFQYVTFVKRTDCVSSHFKHSRGETNKNCEDRSGSSSVDSPHSTPLPEFPLKLTMDGPSASLSMGIPPVGEDELLALSQQQGSLTITCGQHPPGVYRIDASRFIPNTTNWFALTLTSPFRLTVAFKPELLVPKLWKLPIPRIPPEGALFDASTGRRICEKGDVQVGKAYYLLRSRIRTLYPNNRDISIQSFQQDGYWTVHKICALRMSDDASAFFFDELHMRLTQQPSSIDILWPPVIQNDDVADTKRDHLWIYVRGEQDIQAYPLNGNHVFSALRISPSQKVYKIRNSGSLQLICAERYSQTLQCLYIRPPVLPQVNPPSRIRITDGDDKEISDVVLHKVPSRKTLRFLSAVDGSITVSDADGFCYSKHLPAEQEVRVTDLKKGMTLTLRQGCAAVGIIHIEEHTSAHEQVDDNLSWTGPLVAFPSRFAGILSKIPVHSLLYKRTQQALKAGHIPRSGYIQLLQLMED